MKKMLGTFRGKMIAIILVIALVSTTGVVFASTNAGEQLRTWYNGLFNQKVIDIESDLEEYTESKIPGLEAELEQLKHTAGIDIDLSRELATGETLEELIQAKLEHIEGIDAEEYAILENIGLQFYNVFLNGYNEIQRNAGAGLEYATTNLTTYTTDSGELAMQQMTTDIHAARDQAVSELEGAIHEAQERLAQEVASQEEITSRNLRNQVNWAIEGLRENVTSILETLVSEQESIIIAKAGELEAEAKSALDEVVSGINK